MKAVRRRETPYLDLYTEIIHVGISDRVRTLLQLLPESGLFLEEGQGKYYVLTIYLVNKSDVQISELSALCFRGPLRYDIIDFAQQFDQLLQRDLLSPKVEVSEDYQGLVSQACLAGAYLNLFFSVDTVDESEAHIHPRYCWVLPNSSLADSLVSSTMLCPAPMLNRCLGMRGYPSQPYI